jgi:hypothetical protein
MLPTPPLHITRALEALREVHRLLAAMIAEQAPNLRRIRTESVRPGDDLSHALRRFCEALTGLRAARSLPLDDSRICPWILGIDEDNDRPIYLGVDGVWLDLLPQMLEVLGQRRSSPERWERTVVEPIEAYHRAWVEWLTEPVLGGTATLPLPHWMSAQDLASLTGQTPDAVVAYLRECRERYPDCYYQVNSDDRRRGGAKYMYHTGTVLPLLQAKRPYKRRGDFTDI